MEDGGMTGAGIKLQTFRDALHQNNAEQGERQERKRFHLETYSSQRPIVVQTSVLHFCRWLFTCRDLSRFWVDGGCCSGLDERKEP